MKFIVKARDLEPLYQKLKCDLSNSEGVELEELFRKIENSKDFYYDIILDEKEMEIIKGVKI